jgi:hypothetical protein
MKLLDSFPAFYGTQGPPTFKSVNVNKLQEQVECNFGVGNWSNSCALTISLITFSDNC